MNKMESINMNNIKIVTVIFVIFLVTAVSAQEANQKAFLHFKNISEQVFDKISEHYEKYSEINNEVLRHIVKEELMPFVDTKYITSKILSRNIKSLDKTEKIRFLKAIERNLLFTYSNMMSLYKGHQFKLFPGALSKSGRFYTAKLLVLEKNKNIEITFKLRKAKNSNKWKIYDAIVEGVSLVESKKAEFQSQINKAGVANFLLELESSSAS